MPFSHLFRRVYIKNTLLLGMCAVLICCLTASAQQTAVQSLSSTAQPSANPPIVLTLQDALSRAKAINPELQAAVTDLGLAQQDRIQGRAALLPNVNYATQFIYTQGHGIPGVGRFIANNGVHEYLAQGQVHQAMSLAAVADFRRANAALAVAKAKSEIATRGLVVTVVQAYYGYLVAQRKYANVQMAAAEAERFLILSQKLENGGEVAHSDVIKAQIQSQEQQRGLQEATLEMNRSRLELAVLLFRDFEQDFSIVDDLQLSSPLLSWQEIQAAASDKNPDLRAALAALRVADQEVSVARSGLLPSLALDYFYGIDANQFATRSPEGFRNLGYAATATLELPIWAWGANRSKVRQANLRRDLAKVELSFTQRQLLANLRSFYDEAQTARSQLQSLAETADLAAESARLTTLRYQAGEATALEVVDAQNTLMQTRNAYDDGQARYRTSLARLQTLTGVF
jgi:outer membrane protein TolC